MNDEFWFPWYPSIYLKNTRHLTLEQDCIYRRLIDEYMETREPLPDNDAALARISGISLECAADALRILRAFFVPENGFLFHVFCNELLDDQDKRSKKRSESSKRAAKKRWLQHNENKRKNAPPTNPQCEPDANGMRGNATCTETSTETERKSEESYSLPSASDQKPIFDEILDAFEKFWEIYPRQRRGNREKAYAAYRRALKRSTKEEIHGGLENYRSSDEVASGLGKGAAAWLNDDRWSVDYSIRPKPGGNKNSQPQASYLDKVAAAARIASANIKARRDADRDQPWNVQQPRIAQGDGRKSGGLPQIEIPDLARLPGTKDRDMDAEGYDGCSDAEEHPDGE